MGILNCKKHGQQPFFETCEHYYQDFNAGNDSEIFNVPILNLKVCKQCYDEYDFSDISSLNIEDVMKLEESVANRIEQDVFLKYDSLKRKIICFQCYSDFKSKNEL